MVSVLYPILIATKITNKEVINARVLLDKNFIFSKFPICPPINTHKKEANNLKIHQIQYLLLVDLPHQKLN